MTQYPADPLRGAEAARVAELSHERIRQLAETGRLPFFRTPFGRVYSRADVERLVRERQERQRRASN